MRKMVASKGLSLEYRCKKCSKLIALEKGGKIGAEIKCLRCGTINSIFENTEGQVIITDVEGTIIFANKEVEEATGYALDEIIGKKPSLWGKQMSRAFYQKFWRDIKDKKQPISRNLINRKKDGTLYRVRLRVSPILGPNKDIKFFVGIETVPAKKKAK